MERILAIHNRSRQTCGMPRIHFELTREGFRIGRKRVARLMRAAGPQGVSRRKGTRTTIRGKEAQVIPDLVKRNFLATTPIGKRCQEAGVRPSTGSVGDCLDNALCESFFATLECELRQQDEGGDDNDQPTPQ